jgi:hypothetical protein
MSTSDDFVSNPVAQTQADYFAEALTIDPQSSGARDGLTQARSLLAKNPRRRFLVQRSERVRLCVPAR